VTALEVEVPLGGRVLVVADLLLDRRSTAVTDVATSELATAVEAWDGPGTLVVAGGFAAAGVDPVAALGAHPRLQRALDSFAAAEGRSCVSLGQPVPGFQAAEAASPPGRARRSP
jgi:hypothetical protein